VAWCVRNKAVDGGSQLIADRDETQVCRCIYVLSSQCAQRFFWLLWSSSCILMYLYMQLLSVQITLHCSVAPA
jgi:hypothetical protein